MTAWPDIASACALNAAAVTDFALAVAGCVVAAVCLLGLVQGGRGLLRRLWRAR